MITLGLYRKVPLGGSNQSELDTALTAGFALERMKRRYWFDDRVHAQLVESDRPVPSTIYPIFSPSIWTDIVDQHNGPLIHKTMLWGGSDPSRCGYAMLNGNYGVTTRHCDEETMFHEEGHLRDVSHSNTAMLVDGVWRIIEYKDQTDIMGRKPRPTAWHGLNYRKLHLANKVVEITEPGDFVLGCLETPLPCRHENEWQLLVLPTGNGWHRELVLSRRKVRGYQATVGPSYADTVFVHWRDHVNGTDKSFRGEYDFQLGERKEMPNGWTVEALEANVNQILLRVEQ
jgi:hypothetical protein